MRIKNIITVLLVAFYMPLSGCMPLSGHTQQKDNKKPKTHKKNLITMAQLQAIVDKYDVPDDKKLEFTDLSNMNIDNINKALKNGTRGMPSSGKKYLEFFEYIEANLAKYYNLEVQRDVSEQQKDKNEPKTEKNNLVTMAELYAIRAKYDVPDAAKSIFMDLRSIKIDSVNKALKDGIIFSSKKAYLYFSEKQAAAQAKEFNSKEYRAYVEMSEYMEKKDEMTESEKDSFLIEYDKKYGTDNYERFGRYKYREVKKKKKKEE